MLFARPTPNPNGLMRASRFWKPWATWMTPQTGLLLLQCANFCKVVYSARVTMGHAPSPPHSCPVSLWCCLEALCTGPLPGQAHGRRPRCQQVPVTLAFAMPAAMLRRGFRHSPLQTRSFVRNLTPTRYSLRTRLWIFSTGMFCPVIAFRRPCPTLWASRSYPERSTLLQSQNWARHGRGKRPPALICNCCSSLGPGPGYTPRLQTTSACMWILRSSESCGLPVTKVMFPFRLEF